MEATIPRNRVAVMDRRADRGHPVECLQGLELPAVRGIRVVPEVLQALLAVVLIMARAGTVRVVVAIRALMW